MAIGLFLSQIPVVFDEIGGLIDVAPLGALAGIALWVALVALVAHTPIVAHPAIALAQRSAHAIQLATIAVFAFAGGLNAHTPVPTQSQVVHVLGGSIAWRMGIVEHIHAAFIAIVSLLNTAIGLVFVGPIRSIRTSDGESEFSSSYN